MVYDPRPQHAREVDKLALETLRCELLCINKPCALLNLLVPSFEKIANVPTYCRKPGFSRLPVKVSHFVITVQKSWSLRE